MKIKPEDEHQTRRLDILLSLPVHSAIVQKKAIETVLVLISEHCETINRIDYDKCTALDHALKPEYEMEDKNHQVIKAIVKHSLPLKVGEDGEIEHVDAVKHGYAWSKFFLFRYYSFTIFYLSFIVFNLTSCLKSNFSTGRP